MKELRQMVVVLCALVLTPFVIFVGTSTNLYLGNQEDLAFQQSVLIPFLLLALATLLVGVLVALLARFWVGRFLLWAYHLAGVFFFLFSLLNQVKPDLLNAPAALGTFAALYLVTLGVFSWTFDPRRATKVLAVVGIFLVVVCVGQFATTVEHSPRIALVAEKLGYDLEQGAKAVAATDAKRRPNIYHLLLDGFQSDMFEFCTSEEERKRELAGFFYFPENRALYRGTRLSEASIFRGTPFNYISDQGKFFLQRFNATQSFLHPLKEAGYETFGFHNSLRKRGGELFDHFALHRDHVEMGTFFDNTAIFRNLWMAAYLPDRVVSHFISEEEIRALKDHDVLPATSQAFSYLAFRNFLEIEGDLAPNNRYTFLHLLIPHRPWVLDCECQPVDPENDLRKHPDRVIAQHECGVKIIRELVECLKALGRFEDSLILIHADHGGYMVVKDGELSFTSRDRLNLNFNRARSRALLLFKPPAGDLAPEEFYVSDAETSLLDVAPTILDAVGIQPADTYRGVSLLNPDHWPRDRVRYFHGYKIDGTGFTERMTRFKIDNGTFVRDKVIKIGKKR